MFQGKIKLARVHVDAREMWHRMDIEDERDLILSFPGLAAGKSWPTVYIYVPKSQTHLLLGQSYVIRRQPVPLCRQQNDFLENPVAWGSHRSMEDAGSAESSAWLGMVQGNHSVFHVPRVSLKLSVGSCWCMQEGCAFGGTAKSNIHLVLSFPGLSPGKLLPQKIHEKAKFSLC